MINTIEELIANSGDAQLLDYDYVSGKLTFSLKLDELDCEVQLQLFTSVVAGSALNAQSAAHSTCRLEAIRLEEHLTLKNGIYVPSEDFGIMMKEIRANLHLAYGLRNTVVKIMLRVVGHTVLIACPVEHLDKIEWSFI